MLSDLPEDVSLSEVKSQIAVEYGQSITLYLNRHPLDTIKLAVVNNCTIQELKTAVSKLNMHMPYREEILAFSQPKKLKKLKLMYS